MKKIDYTGPLFGPGNPFDTTGSGDIGGDSEIASSSSVLKCLDSPLLISTYCFPVEKWENGYGTDPRKIKVSLEIRWPLGISYTI